MTTDEAITKVALATMPEREKKLLRFLGKKPATLKQIAAHFETRPTHIRHLLDRMRGFKVVCSVGCNTSKSGQQEFIYGLGSTDKNIRIPALLPAKRGRGKADSAPVVRMGLWGY